MPILSKRLLDVSVYDIELQLEEMRTGEKDNRTQAHNHYMQAHRRTLVSKVVRSNETVKVAQELARHSDPT
jgi:hypothetical protein